MDANAFRHALVRLDQAEDAYARLVKSSSFDEKEKAWSDFLSAASTIYSKLEQGSKGNGRAAGWYGRKKKERKDDHLLSYIHHARNSDEHGIEDITKRKETTYKFPIRTGTPVPGSWFGVTVEPGADVQLQENYDNNGVPFVTGSPEIINISSWSR